MENIADNPTKLVSNNMPHSDKAGTACATPDAAAATVKFAVTFFIDVMVPSIQLAPVQSPLQLENA
jgi:hypothetical protein